MRHIHFSLRQNHLSIFSAGIFWKRILKPVMTRRSFPFSLLSLYLLSLAPSSLQQRGTQPVHNCHKWKPTVRCKKTTPASAASDATDTGPLYENWQREATSKFCWLKHLANRDVCRPSTTISCHLTPDRARGNASENSKASSSLWDTTQTG